MLLFPVGIALDEYEMAANTLLRHDEVGPPDKPPHLLRTCDLRPLADRIDYLSIIREQRLQQHSLLARLDSQESGQGVHLIGMHLCPIGVYQDRQLSTKQRAEDWQGGAEERALIPDQRNHPNALCRLTPSSPAGVAQRAMRVKSDNAPPVRCNCWIHLMASLATGRTCRWVKLDCWFHRSLRWIFQQCQCPTPNQAGSGRPMAKED